MIKNKMIVMISFIIRDIDEYSPEMRGLIKNMGESIAHKVADI